MMQRDQTGFALMDARLVGQRLDVGEHSQAWNSTLVGCVLVVTRNSVLRAEHCWFERCEIECDGERGPMSAWALRVFGRGFVGQGSQIIGAEPPQPARGQTAAIVVGEGW